MNQCNSSTVTDLIPGKYFFATESIDNGHKCANGGRAMTPIALQSGF